ncbi:MAG: OmpA family protein [Myxococcales bacterium]|nr:OmpA family protein [Myxococcales bacterium]
MAHPASRAWGTAAAVALALTLPRGAAAEPIQLGGFFGPRIFSDDAALGALDDFRTPLKSTVTLGARLARPVLPWLVPEVELPFAAARTRDFDVSVLWVDPRADLRFVAWPQRKIRPFVLFGVGAPMTLSSKKNFFGSDVSFDGFGGFGAQASPGRGVHFRLDVRVGITQGYEAPIAVETEISVGLWFDLGGRPARGRGTVRVATPTDRDGDGIDDADDRCPDRAEDADGFEDRDGCPDIDNDLDRVLDIADACPSVPETYNGFDDEDGCPDIIPKDLDEVLGTVEGSLYEPGGVDVADGAVAAIGRVAKLLETYPGVRVIVIGHTDDQEVELPEPAEGEEVSDEDRAAARAEALVELSRRRAEAVRAVLIAQGVPSGRIVVEGRGAEEPVTDNDTPRSRRANRRVAIRLYVPER